ncbi:MAG: efflux RND transporter permease subunit, partial [Pseudomonadota bacterium]
WLASYPTFLWVGLGGIPFVLGVLGIVWCLWKGSPVQRLVTSFPLGYYVTWSGQFEYMQRATEKLKVVVPLTIFMVFVLVYLNFGRLTETLIVMLSVPFSLVGGIWLMYWLDYNLSVAAVVGFIGLVGIAAESGMVMLEFLDQALKTITTKRKAAGERVAVEDLYEAVVQGAVYRIRPVMMTIAGSVIGLLPVMLSTGTGSEVMRRIAAPMVGGMVSATILTLIIFPAVYALVKEIPIRRMLKTENMGGLSS